MSLFQLSKTVLKLTNNHSKLLNGITSNTLDAPQNAFLDRFGRIVATVDQLKVSDDDLLFVVSLHCLQQLYAHLKPYLQLSETKIKATKYVIYFDLDNEYKTAIKEYAIPQAKGQFIITEKKIKNTISEEEFTQFRLDNNIPLHGVDYTNEMVLNVSHNFVSFTKGCYLGQEIVTRVHNFGKPPKKLVVAYVDEINEKDKERMTSKCLDTKSGKVKGFVFI